MRMHFPYRYEDLLVITLRITLAVIFVWFGILKMIGFNPVYELVANSMFPLFASGWGLISLGALEVLIGLMLFLNRALLFSHIVLLLHLLGTFSTFIVGWNIMFNPYFPILSFNGEFVIKNAILVIAGLLILVHESNRRR